MDPTPGLFHNPRIIASSIIALTIIAAAFFSSYTPKKQVAADIVVKDAVEEGIHQDLDSDGLESWEEELWKTDKNNNDTDGDGTPDGEEVKIGRDPNKRPKDRPQDILVTAKTPYYDDDPSLTTTDVISRDLFSGTAALEKSGKLDDKNIETLTNTLIEKARTRMGPIPTQYTKSNIRVSEINSVEVYRSYYNGIASIILANSTSSISEDDMVIIWTSKNMRERQAVALKESEREKKFAEALLPLVVPATLAKDHLALVNAIAENAGIVQKISTMTKSSPIDDLFLLEEFQSRTEIIAQSLESLFSEPILAKIPWDPNKNEPMAKLADLKLSR